MKKVIFFVPHMLRGGVEVSLLNLLEAINGKYEIDIMVKKMKVI